MRRRFYLRRAYQEGICLVDVEHKRGTLTAARMEAMLRFHRRNLRRRSLRALGRLSLTPWDDPDLLGHLAEAALSAGVLAGCRAVERTGVAA
jgi:hypothetical protein